MPDHVQSPTFGTASLGQQRELMLDFALPVLLFANLLALPAAAVRPWCYPAVALVLVPLAAIRLRSRARAVSVLKEGRVLLVRNIFRSYRIPTDDVVGIVPRSSWIGGLYASCLGVRIRRPWRYAVVRSIPLHGLAGGEASATLAQTLVVDET